MAHDSFISIGDYECLWALTGRRVNKMAITVQSDAELLDRDSLVTVLLARAVALVHGFWPQPLHPHPGTGGNGGR